MKIKCPSCGKSHEMNIGSIIVRTRWDNTDEKTRKEFSAKLHNAKREKNLGGKKQVVWKTKVVKAMDGSDVEIMDF